MKIVTEKRCKKCGETKPIGDFYRHGSGWSAWCKICHKAWSKQQAVDGYFRELGRRRGDQPRHLLTPIQRHAHTLWANAQKRATRSGKPFSLPRAWVEEEVEKFCESHYYSLDRRNPFQPSLDRVDGSKSYTPENTRVIWLIENLARNGFSDDDVVEFCKRKLGLKS